VHNKNHSIDTQEWFWKE